MQPITFWVFIGVGAYLIIFEALLRIRRNTKKGKHAEEVFGVKAARIFSLVLGLIMIGMAFIWFNK